jgi:hypothetical protein
MIKTALVALAMMQAPTDAPVTFPTELKPGTRNYRMSIQLELAGADAEVTSRYQVEIRKVDDGVAHSRALFEGMRVTIDGNEMPIDAPDPLQLRFKGNGDVLHVTGGIAQVDAVRFHLLTHFVPPAAPVRPGEKYRAEFPAEPKEGIPARRYNGAYVGAADWKGAKAHRFTLEGEEVAAGGIRFKMTAWVGEDGGLLDLRTEFERLPVPAIGASSQGVLTLQSTP